MSVVLEVSLYSLYCSCLERIWDKAWSEVVNQGDEEWQDVVRDVLEEGGVEKAAGVAVFSGVIQVSVRARKWRVCWEA